MTAHAAAIVKHAPEVFAAQILHDCAHPAAQRVKHYRDSYEHCASRPAVRCCMMHVLCSFVRGG